LSTFSAAWMLPVAGTSVWRPTFPHACARTMPDRIHQRLDGHLGLSIFAWSSGPRSWPRGSRHTWSPVPATNSRTAISH